MNTALWAVSQKHQLCGHSSYLHSTRILKGLVLPNPLRTRGTVVVVLIVIWSSFPENSFQSERDICHLVIDLGCLPCSPVPIPKSEVLSRKVPVSTAPILQQVALGSGGNMSNRNSMYTQSPTSISPNQHLNFNHCLKLETKNFGSNVKSLPDQAHYLSLHPLQFNRIYALKICVTSSVYLRFCLLGQWLGALNRYFLCTVRLFLLL